MSERSDELDIAADLQQRSNDEGLARVREQLVQKDPRFNGVDCIECGDPLPAVRLAYKRVRCTPCQQEADDRAKMRRA
jgi:RNA polymerase-binding transcription factor DksA